MLSDLVHRLWNRTQAYRRVYTALMDERARQTVHDEHRLIVAAIRDGDLDSAESLLAGHIRRTRRQLAATPRSSPRTRPAVVTVSKEISMTALGFLGLGRMGAAIAGRLAAAGRAR